MSQTGFDFFIIGAQKSGTSWLHKQLRRHEQVWMPADKDPEIHLIQRCECKELINRQKKCHHKNMIRGDCNAAYFWTTSAIDSPVTSASDGITHFNSDIVSAFASCIGRRVKLIILLRDPVDRAISAYLHHVAMRSLDPSVSIIEAPAQLGIFSMGFYAIHTREWLRLFQPENMLLLPAPTADTSIQLLDRVRRFLGINAFKADNRVVFPGLSRHSDDDGIWVRQDHPTFAFNPPAAGIARKHIAGNSYALLISAKQIRVIQNAYREHNYELSLLIRQHWSVEDFPFLSA